MTGGPPGSEHQREERAQIEQASQGDAEIAAERGSSSGVEP